MDRIELGHGVVGGSPGGGGSLKVPVTAEDHILGPEDALVTLVQYAEFECPDCGRAHFQLKALRERLDDLSARFVFRHYARDEIHPFSVRAAVTAEAAALQGRFWEMHDQLFTNQHSLELEDLRRHGAAVGLDLDRFDRDMRDPALPELVDRHREGAHLSGVNATPTLFLNGQLYDGSLEVDELAKALKEEAERAGAVVS